MSLQSVKDDYVRERTVLQTWRNRMDISTEVTEVPPESLMSFSYRQGWKIYLAEVLKISEKMIDMCLDAENDAAKIAAMKTKLQDEAQKYSQLATEAKNKQLPELEAMLNWEAQSRLDVASSLP